MPSLAGRSLVDAVYLSPDDNICVAARNLEAGTPLRIAGAEFTLAEPIKIGHKIAVRPIAKGDFVRKFGQIIGQTTSKVVPGGWVHSHNLINGEFARDHAPATAIPPAPAPIEGRTFQGYRRAIAIFNISAQAYYRSWVNGYGNWYAAAFAF